MHIFFFFPNQGWWHVLLSLSNKGLNKVLEHHEFEGHYVYVVMSQAAGKDNTENDVHTEHWDVAQ